MPSDLQCKWFFAPDDQTNLRGPNDATAMAFRGQMYPSLIRESIQNSMDAVLDPSQPVTVSYKCNCLSKRDYPRLAEIHDHIQGCIDLFPGNEAATKTYQPMLNYLKQDTLWYLKVEDSNTKGMEYDPNNADSPFTAFLGEGINSNAAGSGGAFGFGKAVFWAASAISTVLVTTKTPQGQVYFAGKAKLSSHLREESILRPNGMYISNSDCRPITNTEEIPKDFQPNGVGTSVYVLGFENIRPQSELEKELVSAVLRNFWMAVHKGKLIVNIERLRIDKDTLPALMKTYFEETDNEKKNAAEYNPRPFYNLVTNAENNVEGYKYIETTVRMDGTDCGVKLYLHKRNNNKGHFVYMRSPMMTVSTKLTAKWRGMEGVLLCDSEEANSFLRETESFTHDSWEVKNYVARGNQQRRIATEALNNLEDLITNTIYNELNLGELDTTQINGLEEILTIFTPKNRDEDSQPDEIVNLDFDVHKMEINKKVTPQAKSIVRRPKNTKGKPDTNGDLRSNKHRKKPSKSDGPIKPGDQMQKNREDSNGIQGIYASPIDLSYRTWCEKDNEGKVWHVVRILAKEDVKNAMLQIFGVDNDDKEMGLNILEAKSVTKQGVVDYTVGKGEDFLDNTNYDDQTSDSETHSRKAKNAVSGISLLANTPKLVRIRFNSNLQYALRINSDKIINHEEE